MSSADQATSIYSGVHAGCCSAICGPVIQIGTHGRSSGKRLEASGSEIDRAYIDWWATTLGLTEIWQAILDRMRE